MFESLAVLSKEKEVLATENDVLKLTIDNLQQSNQSLKRDNKDLERDNKNLEYEIKLLRAELFARRSEKACKEVDQRQGDLFANMLDEAEGIADAQVDAEEEKDVITYTRKKRTKGRKKLPKDLPREIKVHDLAEEEKLCGCGCSLTKIGQDVSEQIEYIPASLKVIEHHRYKYACKSCEASVKTAKAPYKPIAKSIATPSLLAYTLTSKFCDHLPLYRQSQMWERQGIELSRKTLSSWVIKCGKLLEPIAEALKKDIVQSDYVASDETTLRVLGENNSTSYMWLHMTGLRERRAIMFEYQKGRSGTHALEFLEGFRGYHQSDGYSGYNQLHAKDNVDYVGCWDHARRKFVEITKVVKKKGIAHLMVSTIGKLYYIERTIKGRGLKGEQITQYREKHARPIIEDIKEKLDYYAPLTPKEMPLSKAINYCLNQWNGLVRYIEDPRLRISNADAERVIKPFVIGRKNWLFCITPNGAKASANIYSIIETCKANNVNPFRYLNQILKVVHQINEQNAQNFLPYNWNGEEKAHGD